MSKNDKRTVASSSSPGAGIGGPTTVNVDFTALEEKLCAVLGPVEGPNAFTKLCEILTALGADGDIVKKLCEMLANDTNHYTATGIFHTAALLCFEQIKANTSAITGIETSMGQMGCTRGADGEVDGAVLVCKVSPEDGGEPTIVVWRFGTDGSVTENYDGPWEGCTSLQALKDCLDQLIAKTTSTPVIWGVREDCNTVDNHSVGEPRPDGPGIVAWPQDTHEITLTMSDGSVCKAEWVAGGAKQWAASNENLAAAIAKCTGKPWVRAVSGPDGDPNTGWGSHAKVICCPGDVYVVDAFATVTSKARNGRIIPLATSYKKGDVEKYRQFICKGQLDVWQNAAGVEGPAPDLSCAFINCAFPDTKPACCPAGPDCSVKTFGPLLDCSFSEDEDPVTNGTDIYVDQETCDGVTTSSIYTLDADGLPDEYVVEGELANPDKSLFMAEPPCPDIEWTLGTIKRKLVILDNSNWPGAPLVNVATGNAPAQTFEVTWSDGTTTDFVWPGGVNFFYAFRNWVTEQTGCPYEDVVANWAKQATKLPWGLTDGEGGDVGSDCLFARGWSYMCCKGAKCIKSVVITDHPDAAWVGVGKEAWEFEGPAETIFYGHVGCNLVAKDCNGNMLDLPPGCCPEVSESGLDQFKVIKETGIPGANYDGAIAITRGRPNPNVPWTLEDNRSGTGVVVCEGATFPEFTAALALKGYSEFIEGEIHYICPCPAGLEQAGDFSVTADGDTQTKPACTPRAELSNFPDKAAIEKSCALLTAGCNDDRRDDLLAGIFAKQCSTLVDCEVCSTITLPAGAVVSSFDQSGLEVAINPVANTVTDLVSALSQQGYIVDSQVGNTITVCGAKLLSAVRLEGGELVLATPAPAKKGMLVCDPSTRSLNGVMSDIKSILQDQTTILSTLVKCICGPKVSDGCNPPFEVQNGEGGEFVPFGDAGPNQGWPEPVLNDNSIFSGVGFNLQAAYPECAAGSVRLKLAIDHETSGGIYNEGTGGHNGFFMSIPIGCGTFVSGSGTNGVTVNSGNGIKLENPTASPWGTDRQIRCVEMDVPVSKLAAGIPFTFAAFGSVGVGGEMLHAIDVSIVSDAQLDCSACAPADDAPVGSAFEIACDNNAKLTEILAKQCEPCPLEFENVVPPAGDGTVTQIVPGDHSDLDGTTQTVYDQYGNDQGDVNVSATYDANAQQTTVVMTPVAATTTMTSIKQVSTKRVAKTKGKAVEVKK